MKIEPNSSYVRCVNGSPCLRNLFSPSCLTLTADTFSFKLSDVVLMLDIGDLYLIKSIAPVFMNQIRMDVKNIGLTLKVDDLEANFDWSYKCITKDLNWYKSGDSIEDCISCDLSLLSVSGGDVYAITHWLSNPIDKITEGFTRYEGGATLIRNTKNDWGVITNRKE